MRVTIRAKYSDTVYTIDKCDGPLKPCPFCGSTEKLFITSRDLFDKIYKTEGSATISLECSNCNLDLYEHDYNGRSYITKARILINKWNERRGENDGTEEDLK